MTINAPSIDPQQLQPAAGGDTDSRNAKGNSGSPPGADTKEIIRRLEERKALMRAAISEVLQNLSDEAGVVLQTRASEAEDEPKKQLDGERPEARAVAEAVRYRLAITDLFVEKAQFHLERRANTYEKFGVSMYILAILLFASGAIVAVWRMWNHAPIEAPVHYGTVAPTQHTAALPSQPAAGAPAHLGAVDSTQAWIDLILRFVLAFTGYGFVVLTAVALARGARACLDQRERLLAKRHSLRQGRLYLHLTGGHVTIEEMERAFNWNHEQHNSFTHMPTDTKAPWGAVLEEVVKITPELVKAGVTVAREASEKKHKEGEKKNGS